MHHRYLVSPAIQREKELLIGACLVKGQIPSGIKVDGVAKHEPGACAEATHYVLDPALVEGEEAQAVKASCPYDAIELDMQPKTMDLKVGSIIWATGWKPYDANKLETYGFGQHPDVITNVMMERLASWSGPTQGKIVRPSNGEPPETVAFVQCAGSRDENHLPFCSTVCCLASMKHANYVLEQIPEAKVYIFFMLYEHCRY